MKQYNENIKPEILELLPCKLGDTVYDVVFCDDNKYRMFEMQVKSINPFGSVRKGEVWNVYLEDQYSKAYKSFYDFGRTVFLDKEKAKYALIELKVKQCEKEGFLNLCRNNIVTTKEIDNYTEYWHEYYKGNKTLRDFLGMSKKEYMQWVHPSVNSDEYLHKLILINSMDMPDSSVTIKEMEEYGYPSDWMLPIRKENAWNIREKYDIAIYCLYEDGTEAMIDTIDEYESHYGLFGVEVEDWEAKIRENDDKEWEQIKEEL